MKHRGQPELAHTAIDSKDLLCSKWSMYIAQSCQKPYGSLAFTIQRNAPGVVLKWHDKAQLTAIVRGKSTVGAELLCGTLLMPLEQEENTSASPFGGPDCLESDKDLLLSKLFSRLWFLSLDSPCMVMDILPLSWIFFDTVTICVVCELHVGKASGERMY